MDVYQHSITEVLKHVESSKDGLTSTDSIVRAARTGPNTLPRSSSTRTRVGIFLSQFTDILVIILMIAGAVSGALGELVDMAVIFLTVGINAVVGFIQEDKANKALEKLNSLIQFDALVLRDGQKQTVPSDSLVIGDILFLEAGDKIQADGRIIALSKLLINESPLTGESEPIIKQTKAIKQSVPIGDRKNMVYKGTVVTNGHATVVITAIGKDTEIGKIADLVEQTTDEKTPLQVQLSRMSRVIGWVVVVICMSIFVAELAFAQHGESLVELFQVAVAIAIAAIPEGLVISLTIILAIGMSEILKKKALVRRLVAAETLGSVSVICTDKTGTITEGRMSVTEIITADRSYDQSEIALITKDKRDKYTDASELIRIAVLANDGFIQEKGEETLYTGDSTDTAFLRLGTAAGYDARELATLAPRIADIPFTSEHKYLAVVAQYGNTLELAVKGAPDVLFDRCTHIFEGGNKKKLTKKLRDSFEHQQASFSRKGLRLIAVAVKNITQAEIDDTDVQGLTLLGLVALSDPVRSDVKETLAITRAAGIRTIMITGDHMQTAAAIGRSVGLVASADQIFDGSMLDTISDEKLQEVVKTAVIFARVDPVHKIRIVAALQENGEVVAMTGDGVNDAPAIKGADIGVALGSGTDVAKETADMVLLDDAYSTIVRAVEQGRRIYQNIQKVVLYLLSGSFAEMILVTGSLFAGLPLPILPAQILWMNIVEDVFPNLALAFDSGDPENMKEKPRKKGAKIVDRRMFMLILTRSIFANLALFSIFIYVYQTTADIALTRAVMFVGLGIDSLFFIFAVRSMRRMVWQTPVLNNKFFLPSIVFAFLMIFIPLYWGPLQTLLRVQPIELVHWQIMVGFGIFNLVIVEVIKFVYIHKDKRSLLMQS